MKRILLALALVLTLCQPVSANTNYNICFNSLDADVDGSVTKGEFMVAFPGGDMDIFGVADTDTNGLIGHTEWETWKKEQGFDENL